MNQSLQQNQQKPRNYPSNQIRTYTQNTFPNGIRSKLIGDAGNRSLELFLPENISVVTLPGSLLYMRGNLLKSKLKVNSFVSALWRSLSGSTLTLSEFKGLSKSANHIESASNSNRIHSGNYSGGYITLGLPLPGDIVCVEIPLGSKFKYTKGAFLAASDNLDITGNLDIKQIIPVGTDQAFVGHIEHKQNSTQNGYLWLSTYGTFETIVLQPNEEIIIDNGMFLGCDDTYDYKISRLGVSFFGSILGTEGWGMHFRARNAPMTIYTQTKSVKELIAIMYAVGGANRGGGNLNVNTLINGYDLLSEGGKKKKTKSLRSKSKTSKKTKSKSKSKSKKEKSKK